MEQKWLEKLNILFVMEDMKVIRGEKKPKVLIKKDKMLLKKKMPKFEQVCKESVLVEKIGYAFALNSFDRIKEYLRIKPNKKITDQIDYKVIKQRKDVDSKIKEMTITAKYPVILSQYPHFSQHGVSSSSHIHTILCDGNSSTFSCMTGIIYVRLMSGQGGCPILQETSSTSSFASK